ncbi:MAG: hypothetical protein FWE40_05945 [Oscillospiraceae bacterium]|nr:hypothetical protein [Oscillospiraceae bacterium]
MKIIKEIAHNSYYAAAAWIFAFGFVIGPVATLLITNFVNTTFSIPAWVPGLIHLVLFLSMFVDLMVVGALILIGHTKQQNQKEITA